jgi:hypothetical protein
MIWICEQRKWQIIFGLEIAVGLDSVWTNPQDGDPRLLIIRIVVSEVAGLLRAARRVIGRIEIQDQRLPAIVP